MIRGLSNPHTLLHPLLSNQVTRALSTGQALLTDNASGDVEQCNPSPQAGLTINKHVYTPLQSVRPKLKSPSTDDVYDILEDIQHDLTLPTPPKENGGLDARSSEALTLPNIDDMPLSPLMHPKLVGARRRHLKAKQFPSKDLTDFETLLAKNSYAILLTSPIRRCIVTGNRLPSSMLLQFSVIKHPGTMDPWLIPRGFEATRWNLARQSAEATQETADPDTKDFVYVQEPAEPDPDDFAHEQDPEAQTDEITAAEPAITSDQPLYKPTPDTPSAAGPNPPNFYITASYPLVAYWTSLRTRHMVYSLPGRFRDALGSRPKDLVIREDMPDYILGLFRAKIIRLLRFLTNLMANDKGYMAGSNNAGFIGTVRQAAAVIVQGGPELCEEVSAKMKAARTREGIEGGELPVYDLWEMLGEEEMKKLRERGVGYAESVLRFDIMVVRRKKRTVELVEVLWKLRGYMHGMERIIRDEGGRKRQGRGLR